METLWDIRERGFLPSKISDDFREDALAQHYAVYEDLPELAKAGTLKERIESLPVVNIVFDYERFFDNSCIILEDQADCENVFQLFAILASSYVHRSSAEFKSGDVPSTVSTEPKRPEILPACIAMPLKQLAQHVERKPIMDYAASVLNNWAIIDEAKPMSLDNIRVLRTFTRLPAEEWFYKIHIMIEYHGGEAIRAIDTIQQLTSQGCNYEEDREFRTVERVIAAMERMVESLRQMNAVLGKMTDGCKDHEFYTIIRPWLAGWSAPGVVYETTESSDFEPEIYSGGSGAQSSLMPCFDTFFGILHGGKTQKTQGAGRDYASQQSKQMFLAALKKYRQYMPKPHREYIDHLEKSATIRDYIAELENTREEFLERSRDSDLPIVTSDQFRIKSANLGRFIDRLKARYNEAINEVLSFRRKHIGFAISYISSQAKKKARELESKGDSAASKEIKEKSSTGTGGSQFRDHLMQHVTDTRRCLYQLPSGVAVRQEPLPDHKQAEKYVLPGLGPFLPSGSVFGKRAIPFFGVAALSPSTPRSTASSLPVVEAPTVSSTAAQRRADLD